MANEIQELKFQVGEAWKGVYSSSTVYGLANVVQDPTGLSIYRSQKSGNVGHPVSDRTWWFCIIDLSSIKEESDRIAALNEAIAQDEALRVAAEELRQQHEAERVAAETQRNEAEQARISAEQARVNAESARATAEQQRITAEEGRVSAESARVTAEQARVLAETLRANAEEQRAANEQNRVAAEQQRIERAEQDHQRAESDHATYVDSLGAFDISSYHATDGVLAKYADLTAALGTDGANVPDDLRRGGMSVKFVQSSDNKYIQARLMANSFTTDVTKWQVVDDVPTAGSDNLVKSGGVYEKVGDVLLDLQNASVGKYLSDGSANTDSTYNHKKIDAISLRGKVIAYRLGYVIPPSAPLSSDACYLRKTDNSIVSLSSYRINDNSDIYVVKIPDDASALLISWTVDARYTTNPFITYNYTTNIISDTLQNDFAEKISDVKEEVSQLDQNMQSIEDAIVCLDFSNPQNGKHYVNDGTTTNDNSWACKEIDISKYKGKKAIVRLGLHIDSTFYYTNNSYIKTTNDEIIEISDCVVDNISTINDCITINLPDDSDKLLASWAIDVRYAITPFAYISRMYIPTQEEIENINTQVSTINTHVDTLETNTEAFGFFDFANANQGKKYNSNGEIVSDHSYSCKEFDVSNITGRLVVIRVGFVISTVKYYLRDSYVKKEDNSIVAISELQYNGLPVTFDGAVIKLPDDSDKLLLSWSTDERYLVKPFCYAPFALTELVSQNPSIGNTKYIPIGDSITDGTGASTELGSYATRLNAYFGFNWYLPLARGGMTVVRQDGQFSTYPILKDFIASGYLNNFRGIISISVGTNDYGNGHSPLGSVDSIKNVPYANLRPTPSEYDSTYTFAEGFRYDLETLKRKAPYATIVVLSPISRVNEEYEYIQGVNLQSYRDVEKEICSLLGVQYIDMRNCGISKWNTSPVWSADNLHPNDYGYYLMTSFLIPIFANLIKSQYYLDNNL